MSRNLCRSSCCDNVVRLGDLRGKLIEFRKYFDSPPDIGTRWDCPTCKTAYFAHWLSPKWDYRTSRYTRGFVLDLSYYATYNDEPDYDNKIGLDTPNFLYLGDDEDNQDVW